MGYDYGTPQEVASLHSQINSMRQDIIRQQAEIKRLRREHEQNQIRQSHEFESQIGNDPRKTIQRQEAEIERLRSSLAIANLALGRIQEALEFADRIDAEDAKLRDSRRR